MVVDDDKKYLKMLKEILVNDGYTVEAYSNPLDAYEAAKQREFSLIITDLMMRDVSGFQLAQLINKLNENIPIIILTGNTDDESEIKGLQLDINDYIRKPFNIDIFLARVKMALSKTPNQKKGEKVLTDLAEEITVNLKQRTVTKKDQQVHLTNKEYELLILFLENKNMPLSREDIVKKVWTEEFMYVDSRTIDAHVKNLRAKLDLFAIQTVYGIGYKWNE